MAVRTLEIPRRIVAASLLAPLLGGCFAYAPLQQPSAPPAAALRLRLTTPADFRLTNITMNDVREVDGELVSMDDSAVVVSATRLVAVSGFEHMGEAATLRVPRASIGSIEVKRLSRARTALFVGGLAALGAATSAALGVAQVSGSNSGSGGATK